jgi:hypothetical protein
MAFRFRRSIKILPGIRLNVGKRGISTSVGVRGAHVTIGKTGTRTTVGIPGSGVSYTHVKKPHVEAVPAPERPPKASAAWGWFWIICLGLAAVAAIRYVTR